MNCRLKPRNQKVEIRNGSWVHSSRSLFHSLVARAREGEEEGETKGALNLARKKKIRDECSFEEEKITAVLDWSSFSF